MDSCMMSFCFLGRGELCSADVLAGPAVLITAAGTTAAGCTFFGIVLCKRFTFIFHFIICNFTKFRNK